MRTLGIVVLAILVWSGVTWAKTMEAFEAERWIEHLNSYYPDLNASPKALLTTPQDRQQLLNDLILLEGYLHGDFTVQQGEIRILSCASPVCTDKTALECVHCATASEH